MNSRTSLVFVSINNKEKENKEMSRSLFFAWTTDKLSLDLWHDTLGLLLVLQVIPPKKPQSKYHSICEPAILCDWLLVLQLSLAW